MPLMAPLHDRIAAYSELCYRYKQFDNIHIY